MKFDLQSLVRPNIWALAPYSTARDDYQGGDVDVWLDANESPYDNGINRYPDPHQRALKAKIAEVKNAWLGAQAVTTANIFVGNGSDEAIDLIFRIFCRPGIDSVVSIAPSYGMYQVAADINDVKVHEVLLNDDFSLPVDLLIDTAAAHSSKAIFICSPNNPTANAFPLSHIEHVLEAFHGIVVVDEAYVDFSDKGSMLTRLDRFPGLVVLQTMSKARGMAALRLGLAFASPQIVTLMANVKYPYNIGAATQKAVSHALDTDISGQIAEILSERQRVARALCASPIVRKVYPSDANFLLIKVDDADATYDLLMSRGIIVRNRTRMPLCAGCLRVTIGTPAENDRLIQALK